VSPVQPAPVVSAQDTPPDLRRHPREWLLVAATPVIVLVTHYLAVLPHEFSHSFMAWALGVKSDPLDITWGGSSPLNVLLLINIDENVDYSTAFSEGKHWQVALIAFAGPGLANGGMFLIFRLLFARMASSGPPLVVYLLTWLVFMNLANLYDYVPLRVFEEGDVSHFIEGTGIPATWIYIVGTYGVLVLMVDFFRKVLPAGLSGSGIVSPVPRAVVFLTATAIMFVYFAVPAVLGDHSVTELMGITSVALVPVVAVLAWRRVVTTLAPADG